MKSIVLLLLYVFSFAVVYAQNEIPNLKKKELALSVQSFNQYDYGVSYKFGNKKILWRFDALTLQNNNFNEEREEAHTKRTNFNLNFNFGVEFIKPIKDKFEFRYGGGVYVGHALSSTTIDNLMVIDEERENKSSVFYTGVRGTLGFHYKLNDVINIGAESTLRAGYEIRKTTRTVGRLLEKISIRGFNFNTSNTPALILTCKI